MILRCHHPDHGSYRIYGARGIKVCQRWRDDFQNFLADMGERPEGKTLDRIDPNGNYEPSNCRWATIKQQRANLTPEGDARTREATREAKVRYWRRWRESRGLPPEPPSKRQYRKQRREAGLPPC